MNIKTFMKILTGLIIILVCSCSSSDDSKLTGIASYYADKYQNRPTASGHRFDQAGLTAAHKTLPFGTNVIVTNLSNNRSVTVVINDRGPFVKGRIIDLSKAAFRQIAPLKKGLIEVRIEVLSQMEIAAATYKYPMVEVPAVSLQ